MDTNIPTIGDTLIDKNIKKEHILKGFSDCQWQTNIISDFCSKCPGKLVFDEITTCGYSSERLLFDIKQKKIVKNNKFCLRDRL